MRSFGGRRAMGDIGTSYNGSTSRSVPTWGIALVVLGALIVVVLVVVLIEFVMLIRKRKTPEQV
jgi:hypothetical protein